MLVNQFHSAVHSGDAIGEQIIGIQSLLRAGHYAGEIFCASPDAPRRFHARHFSEYAPYSSSRNVLLLHYSISYSDEVWDWLRSIPDQKIVVYHNITPPHFYAGVNTAYFTQTRRGLAQLPLLRQIAPQAWADSAFNANDLQQAGWDEVKVLPVMFDRRRYDIKPDPATFRRLNDHRPNILFVGRCVPNKRWEDILLVYYYLKHCVQPDARLCLIGSDERMPAYRAFLNALIEDLSLTDVTFAGQVSQAVLAAYYRTAQVFLCMSDHEGFCVPLLESMFYGVPIIAYKAAAVPETLGNSGLLIRHKDHAAIAELIGLVLEDKLLRERVIAEQRERLGMFDVARVRSLLFDYLRPYFDAEKGVA